MSSHQRQHLDCCSKISTPAVNAVDTPCEFNASSFILITIDTADPHWTLQTLQIDSEGIKRINEMYVVMQQRRTGSIALNML